MAKVLHPIFHTLFLLIIKILCTTVSPVTCKVPAIIIFGDSIVDTGNNNEINTVMKSNIGPYGRDFEGGRPTGRFSNGRVVSDFFSEYFGLNKTIPAYLDPMYNISDFATGVVFASAGSGYDNTTADLLNVIPLWKQVLFYKEYQKSLRDHLGEQKANEIISEAVYMLHIGTNDFLENYFILPTTRAKFTVEEFEDHLLEIAKKFLEDIYHLGARKILLVGLTPMGCLPLERTINLMGSRECNEEYNKIAVEFNAKLYSLVKQVNTKLNGIKVLFFDPYNFMQQIIQNPSSYGFDVSDKGCCGTGLFEGSYLCSLASPLSCNDADKYVFWDSIHLSEKAAGIVSEHVFEELLYEFL